MGAARTQVAIIGGGPAGLLLAHLLHAEGIAAIVLERRSAAHVSGRIRAGVLEPGTVALLASLGLDARLRAEGLVEAGFCLADDQGLIRIAVAELTGQAVTVYGQTEIQQDLIAAAQARGLDIRWHADDVVLHDVAGDRPWLTCRHAGAPLRIEADFIVGCDGFHGPSRQAIPAAVARNHERRLPWAWLGILADVPPCHPELVYARHANGFALASMRSRSRSRYYIDVPVATRLEDWPEDRLWDELACRLGPDLAARITRGPAIALSLAPLRSFVCEPMRHGRLLLCGDAAHIVPPTGAKGLNLAANDVRLAAEALTRCFRHGDGDAVAGYSARALAQVWKAQRFSWYLTRLLHRHPDDSGFDDALQSAELAHIRDSHAARLAIAQAYLGQ